MKEFFDKNKSFLLYFFMYCPLGFLCPLIAQYCDSIGFSGTQVGVVTSCGLLGAVLGGVFWGRIFANADRKRMVVIIMFLMAGAMALTSLAVKMFVIYALIYGGLYFFQGPSHGLCDHMILANGENFPVIRALGAIGYACACYTAGLLSEEYGLRIIFFLHAGGYVMASLIMATEKEPPHYSDQHNKVSVRELFKNKRFVKLIVCSFFVLGTTMANNTYFSYLYIDAGGDVAGVGLAFLLMAGSEAVFMFLIPKVNKIIPTEKLILVGIGTAVVRYALYSTGPSTQVLLGTFFLQGMMNGIVLVEMVKYFEKIVEPKLASISVSTYYALGNNFSAIVCSLLGGIVLDATSPQGVYVFFAAWNIIGMVLYLVLGMHRVCDVEK